MRDFLRKEPRAAQEMYERFAPRVFGLGLVMLGNPSQAEDLVQDTFVKVWRSARAYEALWGLPTSGDILVWTHAAFAARLHLRASLPSTVVGEGRLLYSR